MSEVGAAVMRFDFLTGAMRGTHLTLYASCLVHRGDSHLETLPLAMLASARVSFERDAQRLGWGLALVVLALVLFGIAGPLVAVAGAAAGDVASGTSGVALALQVLFRIVESVARLLPLLGTAAILGGAVLAALGWLGTTTMTLTFAGGERVYPVRGRNTMLLDFSETLCEKLMLVKR
jgi:hypothetical protein